MFDFFLYSLSGNFFVKIEYGFFFWKWKCMWFFNKKLEIQNGTQKKSKRNSNHQTKESKNLDNDVKRVKGNLQSLQCAKKIENHKI
jgi:hypothetical protein